MVLLIIIGIWSLAPESKPIMVSVLYKVDVVLPLWPNNVGTPVAVNVQVFPITVLDTLVPLVCIEISFNFIAASVGIPLP